MTTAERVCPRCGTALLNDALEGLCRKCLGGLGFGFLPGENEPLALVQLHRLGDYELIEEIARGGMGVVYKARQLSLNRIVAVKVVLHGPFSSAEFVRRFRTEAEAAAGLHHPNIVSIYEVGEHDGHHFFSMEYIEGKNLADLAREKPLSGKSAAGYLKTIAEAIHYAHQKGILHRDLKPSNLLLDIFDQPRITDFGLAKLLDSDAELTTTGQVLGSPSHIPPEQAAGKFSEATPQADIYSLGAILYHLLTGRPPFQGETIQEILLQVQNAEPLAPRRLNPSVPVDLQTICLKCLQKEPARRYDSAKTLADDLAHFLANEPIHARPVAPLEKLWLWCRRRPVIASLSTALVAAIVLGLGGVLVEWRRAEQHAAGESRQRHVAEESTAKVRLNLYAADVSLAGQAIQRGDYGLARRTLTALIPNLGEIDLRGFEWRYLWNHCQGDQLATLTGHEWIVTCVAFSPDGRWIATGSQDGTVKVWDAGRHELVTSLSSGDHAVWSTGFSPDSRSLTAAGNLRVQVWNTETWQAVTNFPGNIVAVPKTGSLIAVAESSPFSWEFAGKISVWDYRQGTLMKQFAKPGRALALAPDARRLASAGATSGIDLWDVISGELLRTFPTSNSVWSLAFSPDGNQLVSAGWSSEATVWDLTDAQPPRNLKGHSLTVWSAAFSPDGLTIVTTGSDQTVRLWDAVTRLPKSVLRGHDNEVWCAAFSPDGRFLATGGKDQKVLLWSVEPRGRPDRLPNKNYTRPIFSPDGTRIATAVAAADSGSRSSLWRVEDCERVFEVPLNREAIGFSRDGNRVITWNDDSTALEFWSPEDGSKTVITLEGSRSELDPFWPWGFSPERAVFFAMDRTGLVRFWNTASGELLGTINGPKPPIRAFVLGSGGRHFAISLESEKFVRLYERTTARETKLTGHRDFVSGLAFSPDAVTLASGSMDGTIRLWNVATGKELTALPGHMEETTDVAFSPDGRTLASVNVRASLKFWHLPTQRELLSLDFPEAGHFLQFSPDGRRLVVTTEANLLRIFEAPVPKEQFPPGR